MGNLRFCRKSFGASDGERVPRYAREEVLGQWTRGEGGAEGMERGVKTFSRARSCATLEGAGTGSYAPAKSAWRTSAVAPCEEEVLAMPSASKAIRLSEQLALSL